MSNSTLIAHSGGELVSYADLQTIKAPAPMGPRHYPVAHADLVDATKCELEKIGLAVVKEQYAVAHSGLRLFATFDLTPTEHGPALLPIRALGERGMAVGLRHANDKSLAIDLCCGAHVFVCDNMAFSGDTTVLHRMHTKNFALRDEVGRGINRMLDKYDTFESNLSRLENTELTDERAKALLVDAFMKIRVLAPKYLPSVYNWYFKPESDAPDCAARSAWGLHNAFTRTLKEVESLNVRNRASMAVGRYFGLRSDLRDAPLGVIEDAEFEEVAA